MEKRNRGAVRVRGDGRHSAISTLMQALGEPFAEHSRRHAEQWHRPAAQSLPLKKSCCDLGDLFRSSYSVLLAHDDKSFPGAFIAKTFRNDSKHASKDR